MGSPRSLTLMEKIWRPDFFDLAGKDKGAPTGMQEVAEINKPNHRLWKRAKEVHVWSDRLVPEGRRLREYEWILSASEKATASGFRRKRDRERFILRRGLRRELLARYLNESPEGLRFSENQFGKPCLCRAPCQQPLHFNASYAENVFLLAVSPTIKIGVDVERLRPDWDDVALIEKLCGPREREEIMKYPAQKRNKAVLRLWTMKEAYLKAAGVGLSISLDRLDFADFCGIQGSFEGSFIGPVGDVRFVILEPAPGFVGALAALASDLRLRKVK